MPGRRSIGVFVGIRLPEVNVKMMVVVSFCLSGMQLISTQIVSDYFITALPKAREE